MFLVLSFFLLVEKTFEILECTAKQLVKALLTNVNVNNYNIYCFPIASFHYFLYAFVITFSRYYI